MNPSDFFNAVDERRAADSPIMRYHYGLDVPPCQAPQKRNRFWTPDRVSFLRKNAHLGKSLLASHFGVSESAVHEAARRNRISLRPIGVNGGRRM